MLNIEEMSQQPSVVVSPTARRSRGSISPQPGTDVLTLLKQRAQQASEYYHSMGLSNGDLPRDRLSGSTSSDGRRLSGSPGMKYESVSSVRAATTAWSQPSAPVFPTPGKYGVSWIKPKSVQSPDKKETDYNVHKTLPRKCNDPSKDKNSLKYRSKSSSFAPYDSFQSSHEHSISLPSNFDQQPEQFTIDIDAPYLDETEEASVDYYHTLPRIPDETNFRLTYVDGRGDSSDNRTGPTSNGVSENVAPRVSSHLHQSKLYTDVTADKEADEFRHTLPSSKPKNIVFNHHRTNEPKCRKSVTRHLSERHGVEFNIALLSNESSLSKSFDECDETMKTRISMRGLGKSSSLDELNRQGTDITEGRSGLEHRKNKQRDRTGDTWSANAKHVARKHNKLSRTMSPGDSKSANPKMIRRNKDKHRSKSDVPDHKTLLNTMTSIQNERERNLHHNDEMIFELDRRRRHHFAHYDCQSMTFSFKDVLVAMETLKRKNTPTGASKAAALAAATSTDSLASKGSSLNGSQEDISMYLDDDRGLETNRFNDVVSSCPFFRNEIGGEQDRVICISAASSRSVQVGSDKAVATKAQSVLTNHTYLSIVEGGNSDRLLPPGSPPSGSVSFGIEQVDEGANYYRAHFFEKDHQNFFGIDDTYGPVVISLRREKNDESASGGVMYQYRIIVRTCELCTLRGSILEDAITTSRHHPSSKGFPAKDVIEYLCPEVDVSCLKVAVSTAKVHEQLMKVDEQNAQKSCKIGVLYCRAGQVTEEDMYNNEYGSEALNEFLELIGQKIKLNGFEDFRGGLDVKTDSTGTESIFTTFNGYKMMFHVSTLLPYTPNNKQQLLRKRHVGNDIVTIVFQEPGSEPFTPKYIRSHFQHVFIVVRAYKPCTNKTCYRVAIARSMNIPRFGPPIPENSMFPKSSTFREFILTKIINGENMAHRCGKFKALAMNTKEQYLRDLVTNFSTQSGLEETPKFGRFSIAVASRRIRENKEKQKLRLHPQVHSRGALTWHVTVDDYSCSEVISCILGMSDCVLSIIEVYTKQLIFSIPCQAVLGWTIIPASHDQLLLHKRDLDIYYGRGEKISIHTSDSLCREEIILRLERFTKGTSTIYRQLRRNQRGQLGFHVNYEGIVVEVESNDSGRADELQQSSRLVEICKVAVATMTSEEILDLLRTSERVTVVIIPPNDDGTPRKCSMELYHLYPVLEVQKVPSPELQLASIAHERSQSEPVHADGLAKKKSYSRQVSEDIHNIPRSTKRIRENQVGNQIARDLSPDNTKPSSVDSSFLNNRVHTNGDTQTTLLATASKLALVESTAGYRGKERKVVIDNHSQSSATNTMSSTKSTASSNFSAHSVTDVDWTDQRGNEVLLCSSQSLSSDSGMNSNNNSSYSSTLSRDTNTPIVSRIPTNQLSYDDQRDSRHLNQNNNSIFTANHQASKKSAKFKAGWNTVTLDLKPKQSQKGGNAMSPCAASSGLESAVHTPIRWRNPTEMPSRSYSEMSKKPTSQQKSKLQISRRKARDVHTSASKRKGMIWSNTSFISNPSHDQNTWKTRTDDVQNNLIRLLTAESPTKQHSPKRASPNQRSPVRSASQRISPNRKRSPVSSAFRPRPTLSRCISDESLCGALADDVITARQGTSEMFESHDFLRDRQSGSMDSLAPLSAKGPAVSYRNFSARESSPVRGAPTLFPLPDESDSWDLILDAARAAEVFEAASVKSVSMGTLTEVGDSPELPSALSRNAQHKRTMSVEQLYDYECCGNQGNPVNTRRKRQPITPSNDHFSQYAQTSQALPMTSLSDSDSNMRLERIEMAMAVLQEELKKEQKSKKFLEEQVSSLRRDNQRLLRHVETKPSAVLGFKHVKRKASSMN